MCWEILLFGAFCGAYLVLPACNAKKESGVWHAHDGFGYGMVEGLELCLEQQDDHVAHDAFCGGQLTRYDEYTISLSDRAFLKCAVVGARRKWNQL